MGDRESKEQEQRIENSAQYSNYSFLIGARALLVKGDVMNNINILIIEDDEDIR